MAKTLSGDGKYQSKLSFSFSVRTLFVLLTVTAVSAALLGGLLNAVNKEMSNVILFIPAMAAAPLALMVLVNYVLKFGDWVTSRRVSHRPEN